MTAVDRIWVLSEPRDGEPISIVVELLGAARGLSHIVEAVTWGASCDASRLGRYGATRVYDVGDIGDSLPGPKVAAAIAAQVKVGNRPDAILIGATYDGRDIAARLSVQLDLPVLANVVGIVADEGGLTTEHSIFGGSVVLRARFTAGPPGIFLVQPKSFDADPASVPGAGTPEAVATEAPETGARDTAGVVARHADGRVGPKLDEAHVVVAGGRGLGSAGNFELVAVLARLLNGAPGASRAIVDAGWVPYAFQVGQTGKTVKPNVYIACGISGATQHLVGMKDAKNIIAINKDSQAPIFGIADLGVVGDATAVIPRLIAAIKARGTLRS
jgi:electron transfer flavoprotein alpha subunit